MNASGPPRDLARQFPHWLRDVDVHLPIAAHFFVHGNIRDRHLVPEGENFRFLDTTAALAALLARSDYRLILTYDPVAGLGMIPDTEQARSVLGDLSNGERWAERLGRALSPAWLADLFRDIQPAQPRHRIALLIDYASQFAPSGAPTSDDLHEMFRTALHCMHHTRKSYGVESARKTLYNPIFWILDRPSDLPAWLVGARDGSHMVPVPSPDLDVRSRAGLQLAAGSAQGPLGSFTDDQLNDFVSLTEGMTLRAMQEILQLALDQRLVASNIADAVRMYRVGLIENPWNQVALKGKIRSAEDVLPNKVFGQPGAVRRSLDILTRSSTGLTSAHTGGRSAGPRGVLFLAGPTGVGKTELAKQLTELLFGNAEAYIRFDMSEFAHDGSDLRLIGSPPGYVGHEAGGELTNAVRQRPFSLILFDEIEKANHKIMDKFLQILSDGRLTDGSGSTVHFSEAVIVFTSNKGMSEPLPESGLLPNPSMPFDELDQHVRNAVGRHFTEELGRPEILNRIGDNIVVFDFIRAETGERLLTLFTRNVIEQVKDLHGIDVDLRPRAEEVLRDECLSDLSMGGRGVGQKVEAVLTNPLSRLVFFHKESDGPIVVSDITKGGDGTWQLQIGSS